MHDFDFPLNNNKKVNGIDVAVRCGGFGVPYQVLEVAAIPQVHVHMVAVF